MNLAKADEYLFSHELIKIIPRVQTVVDPIAITQKNSLQVVGTTRDEHKKSSLLKSCIFTILMNIKSRSFVNFHLSNKKKVWVTNSWSDNYFHWVCDVVPKLLILRSQISNTNSFEIVFPRELYKKFSFVRETFEILSLTSSLKLTSPLSLIRNVSYIPDLAPAGNYRTEFIDEMRETFSTNLNFVNLNKDRRIYSRRDTGAKRSIANEKEILQVLKRYGFETVDFDKLAFKDQLRTLANCDILIGPHGANLCNAFMMPKESLLIELREKHDHHNNCYFSLASAASLNYGYSLHNQDENGAFSVNPSILENDIKDIFSKTGHRK